MKFELEEFVQFTSSGNPPNKYIYGDQWYSEPIYEFGVGDGNVGIVIYVHLSTYINIKKFLNKFIPLLKKSKPLCTCDDLNRLVLEVTKIISLDIFNEIKID